MTRSSGDAYVTALLRRACVLPPAGLLGLTQTVLQLVDTACFCFPLQDVQNKLKESAQCVGDEFMNCKLAPRAKVLLLS